MENGCCESGKCCEPNCEEKSATKVVSGEMTLQQLTNAVLQLSMMVHTAREDFTKFTQAVQGSLMEMGQYIDAKCNAQPEVRPEDIKQ